MISIQLWGFFQLAYILDFCIYRWRHSSNSVSCIKWNRKFKRDDMSYQTVWQVANVIEDKGCFTQLRSKQSLDEKPGTKRLLLLSKLICSHLVLKLFTKDVQVYSWWQGEFPVFAVPNATEEIKSRMCRERANKNFRFILSCNKTTEAKKIQWGWS